MKTRLMERSAHKSLSEFVPPNMAKLWNRILPYFMMRDNSRNITYVANASISYALIKKSNATTEDQNNCR